MNIYLIESTRSEDKMNYSVLDKSVKNDIMKQAGISISYDEWKDSSTKGQRCGIVGCSEKPTSRCPTCRNWYCYEHVKIHFHSMSNNDLEDHKRKQIEGK
jgi:hypothetical protein